MTEEKIEKKAPKTVEMPLVVFNEVKSVFSSLPAAAFGNTPVGNIHKLLTDIEQCKKEMRDAT